MFLNSVKRLELLQLESLLQAFIMNDSNLTESQVNDVIEVQDTIKANNKINLSEEAYSSISRVS